MNATAWILIVGGIVVVSQLHNIAKRLRLILDQLREDARERTDRAEYAGDDECDMQRAPRLRPLHPQSALTRPPCRIQTRPCRKNAQ